MQRIKELWGIFSEKVLRKSRSLTDILPIAAYLSLWMTIIGGLLANGVYNVPSINDLFMRLAGGDEGVAEFLKNYSLFIGIWAMFFLFVLPRKKNWPMLRMLVPKRNVFKQILVGFLMGFGSNAFCILMSVLLGDIKLYYYGFDPVPFLAFVVAVFIQSGGEEVVDRLYLYSKLRRRYKSPLVAILANPLAFALMHMGNQGFTFLAGMQIFIVGVVFSELVYWYDGLWIAMTFHASWNFCQSIFFGLPNSGIVSSYSVFKLDAASAENGFFYNVNFGVEGSIGAFLVLLIIAAVIFVINRKKPEKLDVWAPYDRDPEAVQTDGPETAPQDAE